ncbi:MAG: hypothetical protein IPP56_15800 [Bacteroidetes bacterium]|nr:hypothetical protein [Bacteroidota bacterium]
MKVRFEFIDDVSKVLGFATDLNFTGWVISFEINTFNNSSALVTSSFKILLVAQLIYY